MVFDEDIIRKLEAVTPAAWSGEVYRHMFGDNQPDRENVRGARWNPPDVAAIYASLDRATAIAEADYYMNLQPLRPKAKRVLYRLQVSLSSVLDLSDWNRLLNFGLVRSYFTAGEYDDTQHLGGAVAWLRNDGLLAPSARRNGINLVVFPGQQRANYEFRVLGSETLD